MVGLSPSARKSHLLQRTSNWMTGAAPANTNDEEIDAIRSKECFVQEYTPNGFRTCLSNYKRACLYSDEGVNIFKTSCADPQPMPSYADRGKLNTYLLSEPDDVTTAASAIHLGEGEHTYVMSVKITAQSEVMEECLAPQAHAFQKRCSMCWPPDDVPKARARRNNYRHKTNISNEAFDPWNEALQTCNFWNKVTDRNKPLFSSSSFRSRAALLFCADSCCSHRMRRFASRLQIPWLRTCTASCLTG